VSIAVAPVPAEKPFFLHIGAIGSFFDTGVLTKIGGVPVAGSGGTIGSAVSGSVEAGAFVLPHIAFSVSGGWPPVLSLRGTGVFASQGTLVKAQSGLTTFTVHYHFDNFGPIKPYAGLGVGYAIVFRDIAMPATIAPSLKDNAAFVLQGGVEYAVTDHIGIFVDVKKAWLDQDLTGFTVSPGVGLAPVAARIRSDPLLVSTGVSFNF
jgi:outer membrane protein